MPNPVHKSIDASGHLAVGIPEQIWRTPSCQPHPTTRSHHLFRLGVTGGVSRAAAWAESGILYDAAQTPPSAVCFITAGMSRSGRDYGLVSGVKIFVTDRNLIEADGVHIGGWSLRHVLWPQKANGLHDSSEDRVAKITVEADWSAEDERNLVRRLDLRVLFPCCVIYFFAYLGRSTLTVARTIDPLLTSSDRANIGNVKILQSGTDDNISKALHLAGRDFNWAVSVTYFPVLFFIIPSNLIIKRVGAKRFLPIIMILFGAISMCIAACKTSAGLLTARFFLGFPESGVVPACIIYFSFWYKPVERAWRVGVFYSANALGSGCSGFLAVGIDKACDLITVFLVSTSLTFNPLRKLNGRKGLSSWQWLFLIEGAVTVFMAIPVYFLLLTFPETSTALSERQRHIAVHRLAVGTARQTDKTWDWTAVRAVLTRPSTHIFFVSYTCLCLVGTSQGTFAPTILHEFLGFSPQKANTYMAFVYFYTIPLYWFWPLHSDWTRERMWHYVLPLLGTIPCYAIWTSVSAGQSFGGLSGISLYGLAYLGHLTSVAQPAAIAYRSSTLYGASEQAVGSGIQIGALYVASIISPQMYPDSAAPWYLTAFIATLCLLVLCVLSYLSLPVLLLWEAKRRKAKYGHAMPRYAIQDSEHGVAANLQSQRVVEGDDQKPGAHHMDSV
ncbi:hypothetical protein PG993_007098 [Apiospora rasikravindrae]|uniref:Major facilitator superfamily (MFS) profile domain-containing protein n=1 Tax=Apiospora rasikravindrae TaxID=990691 RepID=A0ABR1SWJ4_9PEZI